MYLSKRKLLVTALFCLIALVCMPVNGQAYYGGGLYGGYGLYGGGLYGGLYGGYGLYGGGLYGGYGLYGGGLYGGLYGGGLYGGYGLYGGGLYGGYGLYGGGLYGGLGRFPFESDAAPLVEPVRSPAALTTLLGGGGGGGLIDPTGAWSGTWLSYLSLKGGICNMNLVYSSLTGTVSGTAGLLLNKLIPIPINVSGLYVGSPFTLTGSYLDPVSLVTYYEELTCTLVSASFMTGTYLIHDLLYTKSDTGEFNVSLTVPVV